MLETLKKLIENKEYTSAIDFASTNLELVEHDYFDFLALYLELLIEMKMYDQAKSLIYEEQSMPYISLIEQDRLNYFLNEIIYETKPDNILMLSDDQILELLLSDEQHLISNAILQLEKQNIRLFIDGISVFLYKENNFEIEKSLVLDLLRQQQVNQVFNVFKNGKYIEINPYTLEPIYATTFLLQSYSVLDEILLKYPMHKTSIADVIQSYCFYYYPTYDLFSPDELVQGLVSYLFTISEFENDLNLFLTKEQFLKIQEVIQELISLEI